MGIFIKFPFNFYLLVGFIYWYRDHAIFHFYFYDLDDYFYSDISPLILQKISIYLKNCLNKDARKKS